jgi:hypothetical protein
MTTSHDFESIGRILTRLAESEKPRPDGAGKGVAMTGAFCPNCGAARAAEAKFCPSCGKGFEPAPIVGWGLENPAGLRPMVVNPIVQMVFVVGGFIGGLWLGVFVLGFMVTGYALWAAVIGCPIIGAALGNYLAANLLR